MLVKEGENLEFSEEEESDEECLEYQMNRIKSETQYYISDQRREKCLFVNDRNLSSRFWGNKQGLAKGDTEKILENEFPGCRKEIPFIETENKYGDAARRIEVEAYMDYNAITK